MLNTSIIIFTLLTILRLWHLGKLKKILELFKIKGFVISLVIIGVFSIYMFLNYDKDSKEIKVLKKSIIVNINCVFS